MIDETGVVVAFYVLAATTVVNALMVAAVRNLVHAVLFLALTFVGVAGVYTYEVAEVKVRTVESLARQREFPLMLSIEPEE